MCFLLILIFITCCNLFIAHAQPSFSFIPFKDDSLQLDIFKKNVKEKYLQDSASLMGENRKYTLKIFRDRFNYINEMFAGKEFIYNAETNAYLMSLVNEILKTNPVLQKQGTRYLFSRAYWPNAFSTGEGTIVFNIGLFKKLDNESQAAFVLCHELSHLYLKHSNNAIDHYINTLYSKDFQTKLKEIKKQAYEKNKELDKLEKGIVFSGRRHGREHEAEADSMALLFMKNTGFNVRESLTCLALLDSIDKDNYNTEQGLPLLFNFPEYTFQNKWIKKEGAFFGVSAENKITGKEEDSLKTHPDCKIRIAILTPSIEKLKDNAAKTFAVNVREFNNLKQQFEFEIINYCYKSNRISRCLYEAMQLYNKYPDNTYITTMIGKSLNLMYSNQKNHTLNKIVSLPSPMGEKNYNTLLEFIQKISLRDIGAISYFFLKQYESKFTGDKEFAATFNQSRINIKSN